MIVFSSTNKKCVKNHEGLQVGVMCKEKIGKTSSEPLDPMTPSGDLKEPPLVYAPYDLPWPPRINFCLPGIPSIAISH